MTKVTLYQASNSRNTDQILPSYTGLYYEYLVENDIAA